MFIFLDFSISMPLLRPGGTGITQADRTVFFQAALPWRKAVSIWFAPSFFLTFPIWWHRRGIPSMVLTCSITLHGFGSMENSFRDHLVKLFCMFSRCEDLLCKNIISPVFREHCLLWQFLSYYENSHELNSTFRNAVGQASCCVSSYLKTVNFWMDS